MGESDSGSAGMVQASQVCRGCFSKNWRPEAKRIRQDKLHHHKNLKLHFQKQAVGTGWQENCKTRGESKPECSVLTLSSPKSERAPPEAVKRDHGPLLRGVWPQHLLQRRLQQVRSGVVGHRPAPLCGINLGRYGLSNLQLARLQLSTVHEKAAAGGFLNVADEQQGGGVFHRLQKAVIAHLATGLGVERRGVEDDVHLGACERAASKFGNRSRRSKAACIKASGYRRNAQIVDLFAKIVQRCI